MSTNWRDTLYIVYKFSDKGLTLSWKKKHFKKVISKSHYGKFGCKLELVHFITPPTAKDRYARSKHEEQQYLFKDKLQALIFENLEPVEITKKIFQHHLNILKNV